MDSFLQGIEREEAECYQDRAIDATGDDIVIEESMERSVENLLESPPLGHEPLFERLSAIGQILEEGPAVESHGSFQGIGRSAGDEALEGRGVEVERILSQEDAVAARYQTVAGE
jgi:hypothetical protein